MIEAFPQFDFRFLKQVHGRTVVESKAQGLAEADAHYTSAPRVALVAQSADCVPLLLSSKNRICAVHSGWRGAAQNIVYETRSAFHGDPVICAAIGPHILQPSFEIGRDVVPQLMDGAPPGSRESEFGAAHVEPQKAYFDLTELVRRQLRHAFGSGIEILECLEDTKTSLQFHSFRRDRERSERQYSFVVINA